MNLSALPELLIAWLKNQGAGLIESQSGQAAGSRFKPGRQYEGEVLQNLANGRSLVRVGREVLDMALPGGRARPGETLRLTFIAAGPRPTFLLGQAPAAVQPVRLSEAAQQASALIRLALTATTPTAQSAAAPSLSNPGATPAPGGSAGAAPPAAQRPIVSDVSLLVKTVADGNLSAALASRTAVPALAMAGQAVDALRAALATETQLTAQGVGQAALASQAVLPQRLRQVVRESGLFYESHLARWHRGELPLEAILREPQARLGASAQPMAVVPELRDMPEAAARLAGRQLMMLEGGPFVWQGQVWPGQPLEWRIEEDARGHAEAEAHQAWRTELRLTLPRLGRVHAMLSLSGQGLALKLAADAAPTRDALREALPILTQRLQAAGLELRGLALSALEAGDVGQADAA
ncbi:MAG: flagellar hook-length control protein FliK [Thiobacillaceae bacterium]